MTEVARARYQTFHFIGFVFAQRRVLNDQWKILRVAHTTLNRDGLRISIDNVARVSVRWMYNIIPAQRLLTRNANKSWSENWLDSELWAWAYEQVVEVNWLLQLMSCESRAEKIKSETKKSIYIYICYSLTTDLHSARCQLARVLS